ncbi:MAG TPA: hypothetical protein VFY31_06880 [Macromonas sp.]|nr:hypothetical protein [Macromonas sp.]
MFNKHLSLAGHASLPAGVVKLRQTAARTRRAAASYKTAESVADRLDRSVSWIGDAIAAWASGGRSQH